VAKDLVYLAQRMHDIAKNVEIAVNLTVQDTAIFTAAHLAKGTPVDVGTARSNWMLSLGAASQGTRPAFSPFASRWRPVPGVNPGGSLSETRNQAGVTWSATAAIKGRKPGQAVYIANNLPYIARLNQGHSKQAPSGFIQRAVKTSAAQAELIAVKRLKQI
jgi:hypothetical protein